MITSERYEDVIFYLGHDGSGKSQISKHPKKFRGFSIREIAKYLIDRGYCLGLSLHSLSKKGLEAPKGFFPVKVSLDHKALVVVRLNKNDMCTHSVYWDGKRCWDPELRRGQKAKELSDYEIIEWWPIVRM